MGTSNFARGNTSRVFAVLMGDVESYDVDDFMYFVREVAKESAPKDIQYSDEDGSDNDRNYCGHDLFSYRMSKWYGDIEIEVQIVAKMVSAYYEGASLDYEFTVFDGYEFSDSDNSVEYLFGNNCSCMNQGLLKIQQRHAERWVDRAKDQLIALTERVFEQVSMPLRVVATFSNGETIYEKL
jgi:hypothetical protein